MSLTLLGMKFQAAENIFWPLTGVVSMAVSLAVWKISVPFAKTSIVTQFLATTKRGADGTYTKNGTYICLDSEQCNQQIQAKEGLEHFRNH